VINKQEGLDREDRLLKNVQIKDPVYALATSPNFAKDGLCFAARSSGLYRSEDGGISWYSAFDGLDMETMPVATCVVFSPDFDSDQMVFVGAKGGILRSIDGGESWNVAALPSPPPLVTTIIASPNYARDGILLVGTFEDGVFCSTDRGNNWVAWNFGLLDLNVLALEISPDFGSDETLYVGVDSGVFRSTNGGRAWREVAFETSLAPVLSLAISPNYLRDGTLLAGTEAKGLWLSDDRGSTWKLMGEKWISGTVNAILISSKISTTPELLVLDNNNLQFSPDLGTNWRPWKNDLDIGGEIISVLAPEGLERMGPLLVGLIDGSVLRVYGSHDKKPS